MRSLYQKLLRIPGGALLAAAVLLLGLLALPVSRLTLEAGMTTHMLVQYPLIMAAGFLLLSACREPARLRLNRWNAYGISGLFAVVLLLAILMIPRVLDLALVSTGVALGKWLALLACGAALRLSWRPAGWVVQGFFLGNLLPMMAVVGGLYEDSPVRVCNAYLLDDQALLGRLLVWISATIALAWLALLARHLMRQEDARITPESAAP